MSFAATLGLVALVQIGMPRLFASPDNSATARVALWGGREIMTLALASLVGRGRLSFPPRDALWRARQSGGDACGVGGSDAGGHARPGRDAVRLRRRVLADHGSRHRLDDRGDAMGGWLWNEINQPQVSSQLSLAF